MGKYATLWDQKQNGLFSGVLSRLLAMLQYTPLHCQCYSSNLGATAW